MRLALLAYSCFAFTVACSDRGTSGGDGNSGGTMIMATPGQEVASLLPPLATDELSHMITDLLYDRLAEIGPDLNTFGDGGFTPRLARAWTWSRDSLAIAFSIDARARWHDRQPVRASDVVFTFNLDKDPKTGSSIRGQLANVDSVTARDSLTPVVWYHKRTPEQFYDFVYQVFILPEHVLRSVPRDQLATSPVIRRPVGTGRFRFVRWDPGARIELLADTANYRGRAKLDRLVMAIVSDASAALAQLYSGQSDFFANLPPEVIPRIDSTGAVKAMRYPGSGYSFMAMNLRDPKRPSAPHPIFADRRVRRAITMALDRTAMLRNVFDTLGILGSGPFPRALADTTIALLPFDRSHATALLDSAGWRTGADSFRERAGRPLAFGLLVPTSSRVRMRYAVLIQEQLRAVGARVNIEALDFSAFVTRQSQTRNFDAAMGSWNPDPARSGVTEAWGRQGGANYVSYSNLTFDALMDSVMTTFDPQRATLYAHRAYQIVVDDAPAVWLYDVLNVAGMHKRIHPTAMRADAWWADLADWSIPANERIERDRIGLRPARP